MTIMDFLRRKKKAKQGVPPQDVNSMPQQVQSQAVKPSQVPPEVPNSPPQNTALRESSDEKIPCRKCGTMILKRMAVLKAGCCLKCSGSGRSVFDPENFPSATFSEKAQTQNRGTATRNATIHLHCSGCTKDYILGENAVVVTAAGVLSDFQGVTILGSDSTGENSSSNPDLVDALHRGFNFLDSTTQQKQKEEINSISALLAMGRQRWWQCRACNVVQPYSQMNKEQAASPTAPRPPVNNEFVQEVVGAFTKAAGLAKCDICGVLSASLNTIPPLVVVKATSKGYVPTRVPQSWGSAFGPQHSLKWKITVDAYSNTDWNLCERCSQDINAY